MSVSDVTASRFGLIPPEQPANELELALLERWRGEDLFAQTLAARAGAEQFVFYEGPPTANGKPGIHHVFARTVKDLFTRHRSMKGYRVDRKAGWECANFVFTARVTNRLPVARWLSIRTTWKRSCWDNWRRVEVRAGRRLWRSA